MTSMCLKAFYSGALFFVCLLCSPAAGAGGHDIAYYHSVGDWQKVIRESGATAGDPKADDLNRVAEAYYYSGNMRAAAQTAQRALSVTDSLDARITLLLARARQGEKEEAVRELMALRKGTADDHKVYTALGLVTWPSDPKAGLLHFREAVRLNPEDFRAWFQIGLYYEEEEQFEEATKAYGNAVRINPLSAQAQNNLGYSYKERHFYEYAVTHYLKAIELRPDNPGYYYNVGNAYTHQEKIDEAFHAYKKALELDPFFAKARYNMGRTYLRKDMVREAIEEFRLYLKYGNKAVFSFVAPASRVEDEIEQLEIYLRQNEPASLDRGTIAR